MEETTAQAVKAQERQAEEEGRTLMARVTWEGLRKPDDPIYERISIVVGGQSRRTSARRSKADGKEPPPERQKPPPRSKG